MFATTAPLGVPPMLGGSGGAGGGGVPPTGGVTGGGVLPTGGAAGGGVTPGSGAPPTDNGLTRIVKGPTAPIRLPSIARRAAPLESTAVMMIAALKPSSALVGAPDSVPVLRSNCAHTGRPSIANVDFIALPAGRIGVNE